MASFDTSSYGSIYAGDASFATARGATTGTLRAPGYSQSALNGSTYYVERGFFVFDTSGIDDGETIASATITITGASKYGTGTKSYAIYDTTCSNTVAAGDFDLVGTTAQSNTITHADITGSGTNTFTLNATGIASINKTGLTKFSLREVTSDVGNSAPADLNYWSYNNVDLNVTYGTSGPANLKTYNTNAKANIKSINSNLIANVKSLNTNV